MSLVWPRHVPPAYTPLSLRALVRAVPMGPSEGAAVTEQLAGVLRQRFAADEAVLTDSGTHALELAIRFALGDPAAGRVVALPAYTCFDVATAAVGADARIVLYDVDPGSLAPDLDSLTRAISAGAHAVVVSPLYGIPVEWAALERRAEAHGATLIEDAAQGHGASWNGQRLGSLGQISVVSFGRGKGWTGGCGGALLLRGDAARSFRSTAPVRLGPVASRRGLLTAAAQWMLSRPQLFGLATGMPWLRLGETLYHAPSPALRMPPSAATMLLETLDAADREAEARNANAALMLAPLAQGRTGRTGRARAIAVSPGARAGYLRLPLRVSGGGGVLARRADAGRLGIAGPYPTPLSELPAVRERALANGGDARWPGAGALVGELLTLPTHSLVSAGEQQAILRLFGVA